MKIKKAVLDIGEIAVKSGLPASTLRYYEEKGLIQSVGRSGLRRLFDAGILQRLALIVLGTKSGFTLEEIGTMIAEDGRFEIDRQQLLDKADDLDKQIKQLSAMRDGLRHVADCQAPTHMECPKFQRLLELAGKKRHPLRKKLTPVTSEK